MPIQVPDEREHRLLTPQQLASELQVPLKTIYQWHSRGGGPRAYRVGRHLRYRREDVERWLAGRCGTDGTSR
ncbi:MAG TPA: helix-turn-helix domain-containing protein [Streptosporangiaceae bacterium]|nr:helix-turn-helix domain-containing protein [Streptosporangiaceae bacterium]